MGTFPGEKVAPLPGARRRAVRTAGALAALVAAGALLAVVKVSTEQGRSALLSAWTPRMIGESRVLTPAEIHAMHPNARTEGVRASAAAGQAYDEAALKSFHAATLTPAQIGALHGLTLVPLAAHQPAAAPARKVGAFSRRQLNALLGEQPSPRPAPASHRPTASATPPSRRAFAQLSRVEMNALLGREPSFRPAKAVAAPGGEVGAVGEVGGFSEREVKALSRPQRKIGSLHAATQQLSLVPAMVQYLGASLGRLQFLNAGQDPSNDCYLAYCNNYQDLKNAFCGGEACTTEANRGSCRSHYESYGRREQRTWPCKGHSTDCYLVYCNRFQDLKNAFCGGKDCHTQEDRDQCKSHWLSYGKREGRDSTCLFDDVPAGDYETYNTPWGLNEVDDSGGGVNDCYLAYCNNYQDLKNAFCGGKPCESEAHRGSCRSHYESYGRREQRIWPCRGSSRNCYLVYCNRFQDLKNAFCGGNDCHTTEERESCKNHWMSYGKREGRDSSCAFDDVPVGDVKTYVPPWALT